jgi:hypothetical protein
MAMFKADNSLQQAMWTLKQAGRGGNLPAALRLASEIGRFSAQGGVSCGFDPTTGRVNFYGCANNHGVIGRTTNRY